MSRRVVVTGMGAVTPIGNNVKDFWENVKKGTVGIGPITKFDTTDYKAHLAAEVKDFDPTIAMDKKSARRMEDFAQYAVVAAKEALEDSGLDMEKEDPFMDQVHLGFCPFMVDDVLKHCGNSGFSLCKIRILINYKYDPLLLGESCQFVQCCIVGCKFR